MELSESKVQGMMIEEVLSDAVIIAGQRYEQSLCIVNNQICPWQIQQLESLRLDDLQIIIADMPQLILIGVTPFTPYKQNFFLQSNIQYDLLQQGINCEMTSLAAACNTWNIVQSEQRRVCLALLREI